MGSVHAIDFTTHIQTGTPRKRSDGSRDKSALHRAPVDPSQVDALKRRLAKLRDEGSRRSYAMLLVLLTTGMRASELVRLKRSDFRRDDQGPLVSFHRPKRRDRHIIRLSEKTFSKLMRSIDAYHKGAGIKEKDREHIFYSRQIRRAGTEIFIAHTRLVTRSVQRIVNSWNVKDGRGRVIATHGMRHHAGRTASRTKDFIYAQKLLGHSDPKTTSDFYTDKFVQALEV